MGIAVGTGKQQSDMNVVPLIDIVLVLLIIFMVLTPSLQRGYDLTIPEKAPPPTEPLPANPDQMVVSMTDDGRILLNKESVTADALRTKLEDLLRGRREKLIFFQAHDNVFYQETITVMDSIRAAGGTVALVTTEFVQ